MHRSNIKHAQRQNLLRFSWNQQWRALAIGNTRSLYLYLYHLFYFIFMLGALIAGFSSIRIIFFSRSDTTQLVHAHWLAEIDVLGEEHWDNDI